jgi:hypothetical protein
MISIPLRFGEEFTSTLETLLSDQSEFGQYDPVQWRCFRWLSSEQRHVELSDTDHAAEFRPEPGRGCWLVCRDASRITTSPISGFSTPTDSAFSIVLEPGWNQIGNPFSFPVAWDSLLVEGLTMAQAEADTYVSGPVSWAGGHYAHDIEILQPFAGYWVRNPRELEIVLSVPPREAPSSVVKHEEGPESDPALVWSIGVSATYGELQSASATVGAHLTAADGWDIHDRPAPPTYPGRLLSPYFPHENWGRAAGHYSVDIHFAHSTEEKDGDRWHFDVAKNFATEVAGDQVCLEFTNLVSLPPGIIAVLVDHELLRTTDLRAQQTYSFYLGPRDFVAGESETRFLLLVGDSEFISEENDDLPDQPIRTALHQNRPNPFNPVTLIRYDVAQACHVRLHIYDVSGSLVANLRSEHQVPGRYEVAWRGDDDSGRRVASGVYFYQLATSTGHRETRKLLLMK